MGRLTATFNRAVTAHRDAQTHLAAARAALTDTTEQAAAGHAAGRVTADTVHRLRAIGEVLATGWLGGDGRSNNDPTAEPPFGTENLRGRIAVRLGTATTAYGSFPALVPLAGGAHLAIDADARDPQVAALLRRLVVRLLAAAQPGRLRVLTADTAALGGTFVPLRPLIEAGLLAEPVTSEQDVADLLDIVEEHARVEQHDARDVDELLLLVLTSAPEGRDLTRLAALTHAGAPAGVCVIVAGYPPPSSGGIAPPQLGSTTRVRMSGKYAQVGDPAGETYSDDGSGLAAPVRLDGDPPAALVDRLAAELGDTVRRATALSFADLLPEQRWTGSSADGVRTMIGRDGRTSIELAFDDVTPHWLVGGRTGAGKTVFLLDVLYGLAARYSPDELALYLLDFKEGVSFAEFVPTGRDPSWIPHARSVGIESDREYGVAVLRELRREMNRRAAALKRHGVTKLADLRRDTDTPTPRIVAVIDEFHVLLAGNDAVAREAVTLLEELARKGRSYGIHLVLASQSMSGIEALYGKTDSIFGQFPLRVALPGGSGVLDPLNDAAGSLPIGSAVINPSAGQPRANTVVRFPNAHADAAQVAALRHELWQRREAAARPPAIFKGYESTHVEDDPTYRGLLPGGRRPLSLVGRVVDVDLSSAYFPLDATPGRHLAVVGTAPTGADVLHAATLSVARQHEPGSARFLLAPLVATADAVADETASALSAAGHEVTQLDAAALRERVGEYAAPPAGPSAGGRTYLVVFGMDAAGAALGLSDPVTFRSGLDDLRAMLRQGPGYGVHLLGWWRGLRRLSDDIGGAHNRDDIACLVALNVPGSELGMYLGVHDLAYTPRANRALLVDRHDQRTRLIVPYVRPGRELDEVF
ncbi:FtsK/SpoIIIE domain-containing protein [Micromonospora sonneratiae]|uniref:FtsK/SpoIIIE domain-containing protein n=1 Tax=Micromonospora sonneratiae TaxID=1184706 RepID=A0ABW3YF03_9ACTN